MHLTDKDCACGSGDMLADRNTHTHTHMLISILHNRCCGQGTMFHKEGFLTGGIP